MDANQNIQIQLKLQKVIIDDLLVPETLTPEHLSGDVFFATNTTANFSFSEGLVEVTFTIKGTLVEDESAFEIRDEMFRIAVRCETGIWVNDIPLPEKAFPLVSIEVYRMLVREALATTRGVLVGTLRGTVLSNLLLPYSEPETFLQDEIGAMLKAKRFVDKPGSDKVI